MTPEQRQWMLWLDPEGEECSWVGTPCPSCRSTVAHVVGHDPETGRTALECALCGAPHDDIP